MNENKKVILIVAIAIILAIIAVFLQVGEEEQALTVEEGNKEATGSGIVGLVVSENTGVEDKGFTFEEEEA